MQIHTYNVHRKYLVENIRATYSQFTENQFRYVSTDRLEYLTQLVINSEPNAETEIKRILKIK